MRIGVNHEFELSGSRDVISHVTYHLIPHRLLPISGPLEPSLYL